MLLFLCLSSYVSPFNLFLYPDNYISFTLIQMLVITQLNRSIPLEDAKLKHWYWYRKQNRDTVLFHQELNPGCPSLGADFTLPRHTSGLPGTFHSGLPRLPAANPANDPPPPDSARPTTGTHSSELLPATGEPEKVLANSGASDL